MRRLILALPLLRAVPSPAAEPPAPAPFVVVLDGRAYVATVTLRPLDATALVGPSPTAPAKPPGGPPTAPPVTPPPDPTDPGPVPPIITPVPIPQGDLEPITAEVARLRAQAGVDRPDVPPAAWRGYAWALEGYLRSMLEAEAGRRALATRGGGR
jgi:hypothetical protein